METPVYKPKQFNLSGLTGISDRTLEIHFKLYEGYVKETNHVNEQIAEYFKNGALPPEQALAFAEVKRRYGFEYNGMVLHEYYFGNLKKGPQGNPPASSPFYKAAAASYGSFDAWKADFISTGKMRGVGWALALQNPDNGRISNHWVTLHEDGNVAGFKPALVLDVWEHAFLLDYKPAERPNYIEAFFSNVDWAAADARLNRPANL